MGESDSTCSAVLLMGTKAFAFSIPFIIAGTFITTAKSSQFLKRYCSLANEEEPLGAVGIKRLSHIQSSFTAFWQWPRKESRTVHTSDRNSEQQADLSDDLAMSIGVLALTLRLFSPQTVIS